MKGLAIFPIVGAVIFYFFFGTTFSFLSSIALPFVALLIVVTVIMVFASRLQWYEIEDDRITCRQVTKFEIPFKSIKEINVLNTQNYLRVRYQNPAAFGTNIKIAAKAVGAAGDLSKEKAEDISKLLDKYNRETTLAKLKLIGVQTLVISTNSGEFRILPSNAEEFLVELNEKFRKNQSRKLVVNSSQLTT